MESLDLGDLRSLQYTPGADGDNKNQSSELAAYNLRSEIITVLRAIGKIFWKFRILDLKVSATVSAALFHLTGVNGQAK